jgi:predicted nucleic-acid-binding protein
VKIAVDTNILVRLLTRDQPAQVEPVLSFLEGNACRVQGSVVLELEWVLRSVHRYSRDQIVRAFEVLLGTEGLTVDESDRLAKAVEGLRSGLDFADAYHVAGAHDARAFATFDKHLIKRVSRLFASPPVIPIPSADH